MIPAAKSAIIPLLSDEICDKCRYMNTLNFDHRELSGEYDTEKDVDSTRKIGSRVTGKRQTWDETTHTTKDAYTGNIVNQYKTKDNVKNYTDYEDTYQTDTYHQKFHVKQYINYFKCEVCGNVTTMTDSERDLLSSKLVGRHRSTGTRTVQH